MASCDGASHGRVGDPEISAFAALGYGDASSMLVVNETPCAVAVVPNAEDGEVMTVLFVMATTCQIDAAGMSFAAEQRPIIMKAGPEGVDDVQFLRHGVSLTVSGFVYPPHGPAPRARARLVVGDWERTIEAFGPRVWRRGVAGLTPSDPEPMERTPMRWEMAYGGAVFVPTTTMNIEGEKTIVPEHEATYPYNFDGLGFFMLAEQAVGEGLPRLEDPDALIARWDDRPEPVCFAPYPLWGGLRVGAVFDAEKRRVDLARSNRVTGRACPRLTFERIEAGTTVTVEGMRADGEPLSFEVIPPPATVEVRVGDTATVLTPVLDCIDVDAEAGVVRFVHRHLVQYGLVQHEERTARVLPSDGLRVLDKSA